MANLPVFNIPKLRSGFTRHLEHISRASARCFDHCLPGSNPKNLRTGSKYFAKAIAGPAIASWYGGPVQASRPNMKPTSGILMKYLKKPATRRIWAEDERKEIWNAEKKINNAKKGKVSTKKGQGKRKLKAQAKAQKSVSK